MSGAYHDHLVLAVYLTSRGFAFVLSEGPQTPLDWGVKEIKEKHKNAKTFGDIEKIVERYQPDVLILEDTGERGCRRSSRIRKLYMMLVHLAEMEHIELHRYTKRAIRACFDLVGAGTKYEIAQAIALQIPAFAPRLPPVRKLWKSEDSRQSLFDAAALAIVYYREQTYLSPYTDM